MSAAATTGVFALAGVLIGSTLHGTINYWLQRRSERRATRAAARLVLGELDGTIAVLDGVVAQCIWHPMDWLKTDDWDRHRELLANQLTHPGVWRDLAAVHVDVQRLRHLAQAATVSGQPLMPADSEDVKAVRGRARQVLSHILIPVANHGPQRRRMARWYWRQRMKIRRRHQPVAPT